MSGEKSGEVPFPLSQLIRGERIDEAMEKTAGIERERLESIVSMMYPPSTAIGDGGYCDPDFQPSIAAVGLIPGLVLATSTAQWVRPKDLNTASFSVA